jgi:glycosyltransferase involved in cell wall biosynthesis
MKVSILIPFYNSERHLAQAIQSAVSQTYENKEIILVDDGSTDNSLRIAERFRSKDVKVVRQPNGGACRARNTAFAQSTGAYIQYLDADDALSSDKIRNQMSVAFSQDRNKVIAGSFVRFYDGCEATEVPVVGAFLDRDWDNPLDWLYHAWSGRGMGQTSIWLTPRHLIEQVGAWDQRLSVNQDGEFFCRVLVASSGIKYSPGSHVYYRSGNKESISQKKNRRKAEDLLLSYKLYETHVLRHEDSERIKKALSRNYRSFIYQYYDAHKDLVLKAQEYISGLNLKTLPMTGGQNFQFLAQVVGFENALKIRTIQRKIFTKLNAFY